jgi:myo-inositol-1(or 4)-monophosphatase
LDADDRHADLDLLQRAAHEAGALAMTYFRRNPAVWAKEGGSPVSEADMAVDALLRTRLLVERPSYGWLSEEALDDRSRRERPLVFVVDPIDGTRGFLRGDERWCVSIAIVAAGRPVVAALVAPARGEIFTAVAGHGAWLNGERLAVSPLAGLGGARIAGPLGWLRTRAVSRTGAAPEPHVPSLAYRFAMVAAARLDAAIASPRASDWDVAAADLIVHEAGGRFTGLDGAPPSYDREETRHGALVAANPVIGPDLLAAMRSAEVEIGHEGGRRSAGRRG